MNADQQKLHAELCAMQLTPPGVALSFEARLARENGWDLAQAIAVVNEYRKFLFLMLQAGHRVTPSDQVDQAWHLHLVYTDSYWNDLCGRIAGRPLHHGPTAGGSDEKEKFSSLYERTKTSYRNFFGREPPIDIWPDDKTRFGEDIHFQRINIARNMVILRPQYFFGRFISKIRRMFVRKKSVPTTSPASASALAIAPLMMGMINPLNFNGPDFLIFYSITIAVGLMLAIALRIFFRNRESLDSVALARTANQLSVEEIAFLSHGPKGPVDAAIAQLGHDGKISADLTSKRLMSEGFSTEAPLLHQTILSAAGKGGGESILDIRKGCGSIVLKTAASLKEQGMVETFSSYLFPQFCSMFVMFAVLALGASKIWVGIERNKPVGFLLALTVLAAILTCVMIYRPRLTAKGAQILEFLRQNTKQPGALRVATRSEEPSVKSSDIGMSVALFGVAVMGTQLLDANIADILMHDRTRVSGDGSAYSGGCGGGDGGGGGCGGGGCGGGCGGCGG